MNLLCLASETSAPGADEFVPVLVYVVIHANPSGLLSTMQYVTNFYDKRLSGEEAYYWMQFCAAIAFIKTLRSGSDWTVTSSVVGEEFAAILNLTKLKKCVLTVKFVGNILITFYFQLRSSLTGRKLLYNRLFCQKTTKGYNLMANVNNQWLIIKKRYVCSVHRDGL